jgi:pyruvate kinase
VKCAKYSIPKKKNWRKNNITKQNLSSRSKFVRRHSKYFFLKENATQAKKLNKIRSIYKIITFFIKENATQAKLNKFRPIYKIIIFFLKENATQAKKLNKIRSIYKIIIFFLK